MRPPDGVHDLTVPSFDVDAIRLDDLRLRRSAKWHYFDPDVIPAWVAEMDYPLATPITSALHAAIDRSDTGYRWAGGLAEALADYAHRSWSWTVDPARVTVVPDVLTGVAQALTHLTEPGDGVVINPPVYPPFFSVVRDVVRRTVVEVPMARAEDGSYDWDLPAMEAAFALPDVTAFLMSNPHNPTGTVPSTATAATIAALAAAHGVTVISDEIHAPLVLPGAAHVPYLEIAGDDAAAVTVISASKAWNMPALKCAQVVGTARTAPVLADRMPMEVTYGTGLLGVIASEAAYREGGAWLADVVTILDSNRWLLADLLAEHLPQVRYLPPRATYLAWLDASACGLGADPAAAFLAEGRVGLSPGPTFGRPGAGHARLNFATTPAILREVVARMSLVRGSVVQ